MSRLQLEIYCPFGRDVSWITQEICESYAGACLIPGKAAREEAALALAGNSYARAEILKSVLNDFNADFQELKSQLVDEFGENHFVKIKSHTVLIAELQERMDNCADPDSFAKLHKEMRELRGFVTKPKESLPVVNNITVQTTQGMSIDKHNPKEVARLYHSLMG
jgi:hypothetical protein